MTNTFSAASGTRERRKQFEAQYKTYGDINAEFAGNRYQMNAAQSGLDSKAQNQARIDRRNNQLLGTISRKVSNKDLYFTRAKDDVNSRILYNPVTKGTLKINLTGEDIADVAMKNIVDAVRKYFDEHGDLSFMLDHVEVK